MEFAQVLKQMMDERGITNYQLAKDLDVHPTTVANWLNGKEPRKKTKFQLAGYFGVDFMDLYPTVPHEVKDVAREYFKSWPEPHEQNEKAPIPKDERDFAQNEHEKRMLLLARHIAPIPEEQRNQLIENFASVADIYLKLIKNIPEDN